MVEVKGTFKVKPATETPTGTMFLPDIDQVIALTHIPAIFFYRHGGPCPADLLMDSAIFETLKDSLSKALVLFYPLAGRLQWTARNRLEVNCQPEGVILINAVASDDTKMEDLEKNNFCPGDDMKPLMPLLLDCYSLPIQQIPLLLVQLTRFSCGGFSLGVAISHVLVDDDQVLDIYYSSPPGLIGQPNDGGAAERVKETATAVLKLTKEQVKKLVNNANAKSSTPHNFTRYEALCGHMWRCLCKARQLNWDQKAELGMSVSIRDRVKAPGLADGYFGNAILSVKARSTSGELLAGPLSYASGKIRDAIRIVTDDYVSWAIAHLKKQEDLSKFRYSHVPGTAGGTFSGNPNCVVISWTSLPLSGIDFGFGKLIHMGPAEIGQDGRSFVLRGEEDGSLLIALRLQVARMDAFKKYFYGDIDADLHS